MTGDTPTSPINIGVQELIDPKWFNHPEKSTFWIRFYECILPLDLEHLGGAIRRIDFSLPIKLTYGHIHDAKVHEVELKKISRPAGDMPQIHFTMKEVQLPESDCVIMTCPFRVDSDLQGLADPGPVQYRLDCFAALFRASLGMNALWNLAHEGERYVHNGVWASARAGQTRFPQPVEGPYFSAENRAEIAEITQAITEVKEADHRRRLLLALRYLDRAARDSEFIHY